MSVTKKKIVFVISTLNGGGAQQVFVHLLKHLDRESFTPVVILFKKTGPFLEHVPKDIPIYELLKKKKNHNFLYLIGELAKFLRKEKPNIVVPFMYDANIIAILAKIVSFTKPKLIICEHNTPSISLKNKKHGYVYAKICSYIYPYANKLIAVSDGMKDDIVRFLKVNKDDITVILNPIDRMTITHNKDYEPEHKWYQDKTLPIIVAVGRITAQKAYQDLISAFAIIRQKMPCRLVIVGDKKNAASIEKLIVDLGVAEDVLLAGFQKNPFSFMAHSDVFALSSHWEGYPMVLIEAMTCGVPVVATRCPSGPDEIITDGQDGLLVPVGDIEALAGAVQKLLSDKSMQKRFVAAGLNRAEDFRADRIIAKYEQVFNNC